MINTGARVSDRDYYLADQLKLTDDFLHVMDPYAPLVLTTNLDLIYIKAKPFLKHAFLTLFKQSQNNEKKARTRATRGFGGARCGFFLNFWYDTNIYR